MSESSNNRHPVAGWVFYDGRCSMCAGTIGRLRRTLIRRGFLLAPLQRGWVQERLGLGSEELLDEMRVLTADGRMLGGAEAIVYLAGRIWWGRPLVGLSKIPGAGRLLDRLYRLIARRRYGLGGVCPHPSSPDVPDSTSPTRS